MSKITCILTLKSRENYSRRFFKYFNTLSPPFKLLIGDGDPCSSIPSMLSEGVLSNVDYEYLQFNDATREDYFLKLVKLVEHVTTPYLMFCDNDDFIIASGVQSSVKFLETNPDYIGCGGIILGVNAIEKKNKGLILSERLLYQTKINTQDHAALNRVINYCSQYTSPCWYSVWRPTALLTSLKLFNQTKIKDFLLMELFMALSLVAQGKLHFSKECVHYIRQTNSSQVNATIKSFMHRILHENLGVEIPTMVTALTNQLQHIENKPLKAIIQLLNDAMIKYFEKKPRTSNKIKSFIEKYDYSLRYFISAYNKLRMKIDLKNIKHEIRPQIDSAANLLKFQDELMLVRNMIIENPRCLTNPSPEFSKGL